MKFIKRLILYLLSLSSRKTYLGHIPVHFMLFVGTLFWSLLNLNFLFQI